MEPFGEDRADFRIGQLAVAMQRLAWGDDEPFDVWDFLPKDKRPAKSAEPVTGAAAQALFNQVATAFGVGF